MKTTALVGYTGFVGSNLKVQFEFDALYNSQNIEEAFGTRPDLLVYAGVRAEKYLANKDPGRDMDLIREAMDNISGIMPERLVLISTIDVYKNPVDVNEDTPIETEGLHPYGANRYRLERWAMDNVPNVHVIRLPGLFGKGIKKNFIYDLIHVIPSNLNEEKYIELSEKSKLVKAHYVKQESGFYRCAYESEKERAALRNEFERLGFSAVHFTDSRGVFQFYNLARIWRDIEIVLHHRLPLVNFAAEPLGIGEIYSAVKGGAFINEIAPKAPHYDFKTKHAALFSGEKGYIAAKDEILRDIVRFIESEVR